MIPKKMKINRLLKEKRVFIGNDKPQNTLPGLYDLIQYVIKKLGENITMVEVGSFAGVSTELFALHFKTIMAVDAWDLAFGERDYKEIPALDICKGEQMFDKRMSKYKNVYKIKKLSVDAATGFKENSINMVYIDGDHNYNRVKEDILAWAPKVAKGGIIAGHDFKNVFGVRKAVGDVLGKPDMLFDDCSWLVVKK